VASGNPIPRFIFKPDELIWIDGWIADRIAQPEVWLDTWNQILSLRDLAAQMECSRAGNQRGWTYSSKFLAWFSIQHAVMTMTLLPANRPALAAEFRRHPFETEIFKATASPLRSWPECLLRAAVWRRRRFRHPKPSFIARTAARASNRANPGARTAEPVV
jgi:hypothetical protein